MHLQIPMERNEAGRVASWACALVLGLLVSGMGRAAAAPTVSPPVLTAQDWREDLQYLAAQMRSKHKSLFHTMSEADFDRAVAQLDAAIPSLNDDEITVRLMQITSMVRDGHSGFDTRPVPPPDEPRDHCPVRFARYGDGVHVRAAAAEYAAAVGGRVVQVGGVDASTAMIRVDSLESCDPDNEGEALAWSARTLLNCPRLLHGLRLSRSRDTADFVIEKNGRRQTVRMRASAPIGPWYFNALPARWVDARPRSAPVPLAFQHDDQPYWFTGVPEHHAVYFQFNLVLNGQAEPMAEFSQRLAAALEQTDVERVVIDLRNNTGGDNTLLRPLLVALIRSRVNRRGGMFVLIGPTTFSAAQNFVNRLESYAEPIFVGQPTAENVNFYGDVAGITLPHSHLQAAVSQLWWQDKDPRDKRTATFPEVAIEPTFEDYVAGRDPALEFALTASAPEAIEDALERSVAKGIDAAVAQYQSYVKDPTHRYLPDPEARVNGLGYRLLAAKRIAEATVVFEVNARTHPTSANAFDSLGEAYIAARDKDRALAAYRKSLELNPKNENAKQLIERIISSM